jgi:hypothetical protein
MTLARRRCDRAVGLRTIGGCNDQRITAGICCFEGFLANLQHKSALHGAHRGAYFRCDYGYFGTRLAQQLNFARRDSSRADYQAWPVLQFNKNREVIHVCLFQSASKRG